MTTPINPAANRSSLRSPLVLRPVEAERVDMGDTFGPRLAVLRDRSRIRVSAFGAIAIAALSLAACGPNVMHGDCVFTPTGEHFSPDADSAFSSNGNWTVLMRGNGKLKNMTNATADKWECRA